jgi:hypothetical protein
MHLSALLTTVSLSASLSISLLTGCAGPAARREPPPAAAAPAPAPAALAPALDPHGRAVDTLLGVWSGTVTGEPLGEIPFAIAFDREPSGDVHGGIDDGRGTSIDLRFHRDGGRWMLTEQASLPGVGEQTKTLAPAAELGAGGAPRWIDPSSSHLEEELTDPGAAACSASQPDRRRLPHQRTQAGGTSRASRRPSMGVPR